MLENSKLKKTALAQLKNRWTIPLVAAFAAETISFLLTTIKSCLSDDNGISFIFDVFKIFCTAIFGFAISKVCLSLTKKTEQLSFSDYTDSFTQWIQAAIAKIWKCFWIALWSLIIIIPSIFIFIFSCGISLIKNFNFETMNFSQTFNLDSFSSEEATSFFTTMFTHYLGLAILLIVIVCAVTVMFVYKSLQYNQINFIIADHKKVSVRKAMRISIEIMKGHKAELLGLCVSFLGWAILAGLPLFFKDVLANAISSKPADLIVSLTTSITFSILLPYITTSKANFYNKIMQEAITTGKLKPEDLQ